MHNAVHLHSASPGGGLCIDLRPPPPYSTLFLLGLLFCLPLCVLDATHGHPHTCRRNDATSWPVLSCGDEGCARSPGEDEPVPSSLASDSDSDSDSEPVAPKRERCVNVQPDWHACLYVTIVMRLLPVRTQMESH